MKQEATLMQEENEALLRPIEEMEPAGPWLRYDPIYDRITQSRRRENQGFPQGVWQRPLLQADWEAVEKLCSQTIEQRSKDMQLAVWRTEALLHLRGLHGYRSGCQLILQLHQYFATTMHPAPQQERLTGPNPLPLPATDSGVEARLNLIAWMNEKLSLELSLLPLTSPSEVTGAARFSLADLETARYRDQSLQHQPGTTGTEKGVKLFESSLAMTPVEWVQNLWTELEAAAEITAVLDEVFDRCYGSANSGLLQIRDVLEKMATAILPALPEVEFATVEQPPDSSVAVEGAASGAVCASEFLVRSREEAYQRLAEISEFLARIEPHSPVPYLLRRAIAWGRMTLQELLPELLHDPAALQDVGHMLRLNGGSGSSNPK